MQPHPKMRKTIKWGGAVVTVLLVVVWIGSGWVLVARMRPSEIVSNVGGTFYIMAFDSPLRPYEKEWVLQFPQVGFRDRFRLGFDFGYRNGIRVIQIPLWALIPVPLTATLVAWRRDAIARRIRLNLCLKCGYDRAGIAGDAKCPECGTLPQP